MQSDPQLNWYLLHFINELMPYAVAAVGITLISVTPLGRAAISWLKGHVNRGRAAELAGEIDRLRAELGEVHERLDFAERRLVGGSTGPVPEALPRPPVMDNPRVPTPV